MRLDDIHAMYESALDDELSRWVREQPDRPAGFYAMMRYQLGLADDTGAPASRTSGTEWASLLCFHACAAVGGRWQDVVRIAAAIELLSNWFRIHDGLEDRRLAPDERSSVWELWGDPQAINTGDGMFPLAGRAMLEAAPDPSISLLLTRELASISVIRAEAQHTCLTVQDHAAVPTDAQNGMEDARDGTVPGYAAWAGVLLGGGGEETQLHLRRFGSELGTMRRIWEESPELAQRSLDQTVGILDEVGLGDAGHSRLEAFARHLVPLSV